MKTKMSILINCFSISFTLPLLLSCGTSQLQPQSQTQSNAQSNTVSAIRAVQEEPSVTPPANSSISSAATEESNKEVTNSTASKETKAKKREVNVVPRSPKDRGNSISLQEDQAKVAPAIEVPADSVDSRNNVNNKNEALTSVSGFVSILGKDGEKISPEGVIINLEPVSHTNVNTDANAKNNAKASSLQPTQYRIDMLNKTYLPGLLAVKVEDLVSFVNKDKIKHNTFSSSGENTFDLGTYGPKEVQSTKLIAPGIVKVYCNIHPEMATFISVSENNYSFITQSDGKFLIRNLPAQEYVLSAWHIRGESQQRIKLTLGKENNAIVVIDTSSFLPVPHKNKFGETYKVKPALFSDEFY